LALSAMRALLKAHVALHSGGTWYCLTALRSSGGGSPSVSVQRTSSSPFFWFSVAFHHSSAAEGSVSLRIGTLVSMASKRVTVTLLRVLCVACCGGAALLTAIAVPGCTARSAANEGQARPVCDAMHSGRR